ncbi:hypothetical protein BDR04DRAFT_1088347 [Suillus decipiens]|nr:hypothetical protein BDR04DRAFT_1088347 [Suillus decipiens]
MTRIFVVQQPPTGIRFVFGNDNSRRIISQLANSIPQSLITVLARTAVSKFKAVY